MGARFGEGLKGDLARACTRIYMSGESDPYNEDALISSYVAHGDLVKAYFFHRQADLLVLNVAGSGAMRGLCSFLGKDLPYDDFPRVLPIADLAG